VEQESRPPFIAIARIARTRGNRGEVLADLYTDFPSRFALLSEVWLELSTGQRELLKLENAWEHKGRPVLKFAGVDTISAAEELVGAWVEIESDQAVPLSEGTYYDHELIGCRVQDLDGRDLGTVSEILHIAGNSQLVVNGFCGEFLVPANEHICREISIDEKLIVLDLPEGLIDLNK
jgi:16S rRNA processing protein RimM